MSRSVFDPAFADLPQVLPIFPLPQATLLPGLILPLNIFEPRYLAMVGDALGAGRLIGMVQPDATRGGDDDVVVYPVGCAGRITSFKESNDGRFLINLTGVARFRIDQELEMQHGYRRVRPDWSGFEEDLVETELPELDRERLRTVVQGFLQRRGIELEWKAVDALSNQRLVDVLCMQLPFSVEEKQLLLEGRSVSERAELLGTLAMMAAQEGGGDVDGAGSVRH
ncbi:MAG: LON peptidase substrate-binding domain-containing protein [Gammaproteobacteria bacterium]|nr:LON peptidase substrate-binding domain-containing protein [Gammaproteobacteria bacterium]